MSKIAETLSHTPGPYKVIGSYKNHIAAGPFVYQPRYSHVASVVEMQANAALFAAAPVLLKELEQAAAFIGQTTEYKTGHAGASTILKSIRAAIALAANHEAA